MKLPQSLIDSPFFQFTSLAELERALTGLVPAEELTEAQSLALKGLPPVTSRNVLAAMFGISPGLIWSFESRTAKYYRTFFLPKGNRQRRIDAPKIGLKVIQKWLSVQLQKSYQRPDHVFGFVAGCSHVDAATKHCRARWIFSVDIKDFFQSTPQDMVANSLKEMGFPEDTAKLFSVLCCLNGTLAQGAPSSPVLSNICFKPLDDRLAQIARDYDVCLTRYADDIVFSGNQELPEGLREAVMALFGESIWQLAEEKIHFSALPNRLKVHGLLVHGENVRLTKGYRNRLRAFKHLMAKDQIRPDDIDKVRGHLVYSEFILNR